MVLLSWVKDIRGDCAGFYRSTQGRTDASPLNVARGNPPAAGMDELATLKRVAGARTRWPD